MSRRCVRRARLTRLGDLDALVADLTSRYNYCHGTPSEYRTELHRRLGKSELRHIMLAEYAGQIVIRWEIVCCAYSLLIYNLHNLLVKK